MYLWHYFQCNKTKKRTGTVKLKNDKKSPQNITPYDSTTISLMKSYNSFKLKKIIILLLFTDNLHQPMKYLIKENRIQFIKTGFVIWIIRLNKKIVQKVMFHSLITCLGCMPISSVNYDLYCSLVLWFEKPFNIAHKACRQRLWCFWGFNATVIAWKRFF